MPTEARHAAHVVLDLLHASHVLRGDAIGIRRGVARTKPQRCTTPPLTKDVRGQGDDQGCSATAASTLARISPSDAPKAVALGSHVEERLQRMARSDDADRNLVPQDRYALHLVLGRDDVGDLGKEGRLPER